MSKDIITVEGKTFGQLARESGLDQTTIRRRYMKGKRTIKELVAPLVCRQRSIKIRFNGKTLREIAEETGIRLETLYNRHKHGACTYEELTMQDRAHKPHESDDVDSEELREKWNLAPRISLDELERRHPARW